MSNLSEFRRAEFGSRRYFAQVDQSYIQSRTVDVQSIFSIKKNMLCLEQGMFFLLCGVKNMMRLWGSQRHTLTVKFGEHPWDSISVPNRALKMQPRCHLKTNT